MAFSVNTPVGDGVTKQFAVNFVNGLFSRDNVHVFVEGEVDGLGEPIERSFTWINDGLIELDGAAPGNGRVVEIRRIMDKDEPAVDFEDGEILTEATADRGLDHLLNSIHELLDGYGFSSLRTSINMNDNPIIGLEDSGDGSSAIRRDSVIALINAQSSGYTTRRREDRKTASSGQTVFNLADITYVPGINNIQVYINGVAQVSGIDYIETDSTTITFTSGLVAGDYVDIYANEVLGATAGASGSFTALSGETITVQGGIITSIES